MNYKCTYTFPSGLKVKFDLDGEVYIMRNFQMKELGCKDGTMIFNNDVNMFHQMMQEFRDFLGEAMSISCNYRSKEYNATIEGASENSQHIYGIACDWQKPLAKVTDRELAKYSAKWGQLCHKYGVGGAFLLYDWGIHLDARKGTNMVVADYRKKVA